MRPTRLVTLVAVALAAAAGAFGLLLVGYGDIPAVPLTAPVSLAVLAAGEGYVAPSVRARLAGRPRTRPILPLTVARMAAFAKASGLVGALAVGAYVGLLGYVASHRGGRTATHDTVSAGLGLAAAVGLTAAALALEWVCRVPGRPGGGGRA